MKKKNKRKIKVNNNLIITAAHPLEESAINQIKDMFGEKGSVEIVIDKSIIGGIRVKKGDQYFDGTIQSKLNQLRQQLIQNL